MQKQNLLKERNGASSKPETHTPSFALDIPVVVIDRMTIHMLTGDFSPRQNLD